MAKYAGPDTIAVADTVGTAVAPEQFDVVAMARLLGVSTSGFYAWRKRTTATELTSRQQRRADLTVKILDAHAESDGTYGSPRITDELREQGVRVSVKTVAAIMASIGLEGISPRTFRLKTTGLLQE